MATLVARPKSIAQQMLEDKQKVEQYLKDPNAHPKPDHIKFVKPFTLPAPGK
jgi:hypothetical protein